MKGEEGKLYEVREFRREEAEFGPKSNDLTLPRLVKKNLKVEKKRELYVRVCVFP